MFIANPRFESSFASIFGIEGDRYFRAMEISGRMPWFIVTCAVQHEEAEMLQSFCCSWDEDLLALLEARHQWRPVSVQRVAPAGEDEEQWESRQVVRVWRAKRLRAKVTLVFEDSNGDRTCGPFGLAPDRDVTSIELVYEVPSRVSA